MEKQNLKVEENSIAIQADGNVTISNGLTYSEVRQIVYDLFNGNFPVLVQAAAEKAKENLEDFLNTFESKIREDEKQKVQDSLKNPNSQYLLNKSIEYAARFGKKIDLTVLSNALKQALIVNDDTLTPIFETALEIIPKLTRPQLITILVSFYIHVLGMKHEL